MSLHKEPSASDLRGLICARRRCSERTGTGPARAAPRNALPRPLVDGGPGPRAPLVAVEGKGMPDGNKSSASRLSLSAMLPQATCSQPSRRGLQQASSARHSAVGVPGMDALGGRVDTWLQVVNARPDAQSRCRRAARSRTEAVVVWSTCHERVGMPEHPVSATFSSQVSVWAD